MDGSTFFLGMLIGIALGMYIGLKIRPRIETPFFACPNCGEAVRTGGSVCPHCHRNVPDVKRVAASA